MSDDTLQNIRRARRHVKHEEVIPASNGMEAALTAAETGNRELARLATLGAKVEALLASEEPPEGLDAILAQAPFHSVGQLEYNVWAWFREQLVGFPWLERGINPAEETEEGCGYVKPDDPTGLGIAAITPKPWRLARSLSKLRGQLAELYPKRSRASDGTIGDARHASNKSDHNPWVPDPDQEVKGKGQGVVTAIDITHDPANGCNCTILAQQLAMVRDPRIKYVIWNRQIWNPAIANHWRSYSGSNPHTKHLHLSVKSDPKLFDSTEPWRI